MSKITLDDITANILSVHYFTAYEGANAKLMPVDAGESHSMLSEQSLKLLTICVLVLKNGFTVIGSSYCDDPKNFNSEMGRNVAYDDAVESVWPLMGYKLKCDLA